MNDTDRIPAEKIDAFSEALAVIGINFKMILEDAGYVERTLKDNKGEITGKRYWEKGT